MVAGKTTLFRLIMGLETVDKGEFEVGETVKVAYVDQQHRDIDPNKSVYQVISGGNELIRMGGRDINARAYLSRFNFSGGDQEKLCGVLSGGERNRLHLAMALKEDSASIDDPELMKEDKLAVILGTEGDGLAPETIADCDYTVMIPMSHGVDSLNVAAASAVAFWQLGKR